MGDLTGQPEAVRGSLAGGGVIVVASAPVGVHHDGLFLEVGVGHLFGGGRWPGDQHRDGAGALGE